MHEPPKRARKGVKKHVKQINELREFILKTRTIPENGFEETHSGIMPPPRFREYIPQWSPGFTRTDRSTDDGETFFYFRRGGIVFVPYHSGEGVSQVPIHSCVPIIPLMYDYGSGANLKIIISADGLDAGLKSPKMLAPRRTSSFDGESLISLRVAFGARTEDLGVREQSSGAFVCGVVADDTEDVISGNTGAPEGVGNTGGASAGTAHTHEGESAHVHSVSNANADWNKLGVSLSELNYAIGSIESCDIQMTPKEDGITDSGATVNIPLGWFKLDEKGYLVDSQWYAEGSLGPVSLPGGYVKSEESEVGEGGEEPRDPTPVTFPTGSSDYTLPD